MKKTLATLLVVALVASLCGVMFVSAEATNLVAGKTYTISEQYRMGGADVNWGYDPNAPISYPDNNYDLTDGAELVAEYSDACWVGFTPNTPEQKERGYAYINFELDAVSDIDSISYVEYKHKANGIQPAHTVEVYVSNDGSNYELAATGKLENDVVDALEDLAYHTFTIDLDASAKYVELRVISYGWAFFGEVEIFGTAAASEPETPAADPSVTAKVTEGTLAYSEDALSKLIDGNTASGATSFGDAGFVSFENKGFTHTDGVGAAVPATVELVADLGSVQAISKITLNAFKDSNSMIALPTVNFYVSVDGVNYYQINAGAAVAPKDDLAETATAAITADFSTRIAVNARYIKAVATFQNGWLFLSELSVTAAAEGNYVDNLDAGYAYTEHSVPNPGIGIFTSEDGELELSTNDGGTGKLFRNAQLIKAKYNADKGAYEIIYSKVNPWPDGHSGTETMAEDEILVAISTGGNIAADANFSGAKWIARGLVAGDYIVLNEGIITFLPASAFAVEEEPEVPAEDKTWENTLTVGEDGNAVVEVPYGFTWEVNYVDGKIGGEDVTICTTDDAYKACNPNWAITILLEKQEDGTYVAVADAVVTPGNADKVTVGENQIALVVHSASSNPDGGYANWTGKVVAVSVKAGDVFVINEEMTSVYAVIPGEELTPDEPETPVTGDAGVLVFAVLAVVAVVGCAVASKIKASAL